MMEIVKDMFRMWVDISISPMSNDWMGYLMLLLVWAMNLMMIYMFYMFLIRPILYKKKYSELKIDNGSVTDKRYETHTTTTYIQSGKTSIPMTTIHHDYYVYLKGDVIDQRVDCESWYNKYNSGDSVKMKYKEVYETFRFSVKDDWKFVGNDILSLEKI